MDHCATSSFRLLTIQTGSCVLTSLPRRNIGVQVNLASRPFSLQPRNALISCSLWMLKLPLNDARKYLSCPRAWFASFERLHDLTALIQHVIVTFAQKRRLRQHAHLGSALHPRSPVDPTLRFEKQMHYTFVMSRRRVHLKRSISARCTD